MSVLNDLECNKNTWRWKHMVCYLNSSFLHYFKRCKLLCFIKKFSWSIESKLKAGIMKYSKCMRSYVCNIMHDTPNSLNGLPVDGITVCDISRKSSPWDHSRKQPALVTTSFEKPCLICVMTSSRKRPQLLLGLPNWTFPLFLSSCKQPLSLIHLNQY